MAPGLTLQVHLVQLSTTQVSFSAKNRPSCQQADMFLVFGGPPMSSQRIWLSLDWGEVKTLPTAHRRPPQTVLGQGQGQDQPGAACCRVRPPQARSHHGGLGAQAAPPQPAPGCSRTRSGT